MSREKVKQVIVEYYTFSLSGESKKSTFDLISDLIVDKKSYQEKRDNSFGLRDVRASRSGNIINGVFAKYRKNNLPKIGAVGADGERPIDLSPDEALLEKNHFLIVRNRNLIVYQKNGNGSAAEYLAEHLTNLIRQEGMENLLSFSPVPDYGDFIEILSRGQPKRIEFKLARPSSAVIGKAADDLNGAVAKLFAGTDGLNLRCALTPDRHQVLNKRGVLALFKSLFSGGNTVVAAKAVMLDDDGHYRHPVNLITKTITDVIEVKMDGRYPDQEDIQSKLLGAYDGRRELFQEILAS
ncbi:MAG: hypothetical protein HQL86_02000 [Magnetococcales bacterium]|nr:hypothetical protein [Magnetococcales bacterium]